MRWMNALPLLGLAALLAGAGVPGPANPVLDVDFPDPMVLRAPDGWYYAYATGAFDGKRRTNLSVSRSKDSRPKDVLFSSKRPYENIVEGPFVVERHGWFYMFYSGDDCCGNPPHNAVLTDTAGRDHLVYHAVDARQPKIPATGNIRRPLMTDPLSYTTGWPQLKSH